MQDIIGKKFNEWTEGVSFEEKRIKIFEKIRDIPFAVVLELFSLDEGVAGMLSQNKGFCVPKHYLLGRMYQELKIHVRYCTFTFKWSEIMVAYPGELARLAEQLPVTYHLACKALIDSRWVLVDATWDSGLKKAEFPVNDQWDGTSDTKNAVKPLEEFVHEDAREREKFFEEKMMSYSLPERLALSRFSGGLNQWLEQLRH
ncbi:hypothetical protein ACFL5Y_00125 [Candidatus Omnitrophota bacterium]